MASYTVMKIGDMEATLGGGFRKARASLGVESFGMAIEEFPAGFENYPEHDHSADGQEEVYLLLRGSGEIEIEGERHSIDPETMVRVSAGVPRRLRGGPQGIRVLAIGGVPGAAYEPQPYSQLGGPGELPDPTASSSGP